MVQARPSTTFTPMKSRITSAFSRVSSAKYSNTLQTEPSTMDNQVINEKPFNDYELFDSLRKATTLYKDLALR